MSARMVRGPGRVRLSAATALLAVVAMTAGCSSDDGDKGASPGSTSAPAKGDGPAAQVKLPDGCITTFDAETPSEVSVAVSQALFTSSPVVVVAAAEDSPALSSGIDAAKAAGAPLLVTDESAADAPSVDSTASPSAAPTTDASPVTFKTDTADCAAPPAEATPSGTPTSTSSPTASSGDESDSDSTSTDESGSDATSGPTTTASPAIEPAAFATATDGATSCLESSAATAEPTAEPTATTSPSAEATSEPSADTTAEPSTDASADPSATSSSTDTASDAPTTAPEVNTPLDPTVAAEIRRLDPQAVLATSPDVAADLRDALPGLKVVENAADLPKTSTPSPLSGLSVLVPAEEDLVAGSLAAGATAAAAGATAVGVQQGDPRAGKCAVEALFAAKPTRVLGVGDFSSAKSLSYRMGIVGTGVELPGGGQLFFPGRRLVALYGYPGAPELGVLGAQGVEASIERAKNVAELYDDLSSVPVVPTFEVIATVAQGAAGRDGNYSAESTIDQLRPWVEEADKAGMYVILDLQSGRSSFLTQAKLYSELLKNPHVGLALDPEWRLFGGQQPLHQIGHVDSSEINDVIDWLANFTAENNLPQKLLVLHQFSLSMITNRSEIDTSHDSLAILVHMDGQGQPIQKEGTWRIVTNTMPKAIWMGWKNFYKKDTRLMSPKETLNRKPVPVMISYQ